MLGLHPLGGSAACARSRPYYMPAQPPFKCGWLRRLILYPHPPGESAVPALRARRSLQHCVKSLRSACLIRLPYQTRPVRHRSCKLPQDLRRTAFPLSTTHNKHYVYFTQCSASFAPFAASTALPLPLKKGRRSILYAGCRRQASAVKEKKQDKLEYREDISYYFK